MPSSSDKPIKRPFALSDLDSLKQRLQKRSQLLKTVRAFFYARKVCEVDTPLLSSSATPDLHLHSLQTHVQVPGIKDRQTYYLHTSPEFAMKRLLCEGSGDIFFLGKVFRDGDVSPRHQVEFTMLEWYRLNFSMFELIEEVAGLLKSILGDLAVERLTYQQAFQKYAGIDDIFSASAADCQACLTHFNVPEIVGVDEGDKPLWEQLVLTEVIEAQLGRKKSGVLQISVLYHFPARDASLAQISVENPDVAERFEFFIDGMELANGYQELAEAELYRQRFKASLALRQANQLPVVPLDENLLTTLKHKPLPDCSGVALGFDRLFLLQQELSNIEQGVGFALSEC